MEPTDDDVRRMAYHLCGAAALCGCSGGSKTICGSSIKRAMEAIRLGAKLPDARMERGKAAYEAFVGAGRGSNDMNDLTPESPAM